MILDIYLLYFYKIGNNSLIVEVIHNHELFVSSKKKTLRNPYKYPEPNWDVLGRLPSKLIIICLILFFIWISAITTALLDCKEAAISVLSKMDLQLQ